MPDPKAELRARALAARRSLSPGERQRFSAAIAERVASLPAFGTSRAVALYAAMGAEVETVELARRAAAAGKRLAWPRIVPGRRALAFAICLPAELVSGPRGTREPPPGSPELPAEALGLVCVPGVAFDPALRRLGLGGGYYDATLPALAGGALRVALAFDCQIVPAVPAEPHDAGVDLVVTELRVIGPAAG
jgi:5-formyltetrahydrofolate cyclo-ligase